MAQSAAGRLAETGTLAERGMLAETGIRAGGACLPASVGGACLPASVGPLFFQAGASAAPLRLVRLVAAALAAGAAVAGAAGCGGAHPKPAELRLERTDLVLLARTLQRLQTPTRGEVAAARVVWPALAGGLPRSLSSVTRLGVSAAERRAAALTLPTFLTTEGSLTGPAAKLAGMLKAYTRLTQRGWQYTAAAVAVTQAGGSSSPGTRSGGATATSTARFLRSNAALYIYCIYDGHYDLSLIGKTMQGAYRTLGGPPAFGGSLTQVQVEALAGAYSIPSSRLEPHPPPSLVV